MRTIPAIGLLSWFAGGILLGLIEVVTLPSDPLYSTILQLSPLALLLGGIWLVFSEYLTLRTKSDRASNRLRKVMEIGWVSLFAVDAGVASLNNITTEILHWQLPYYYQSVSLSQKIIALTGIILLGIATSLSLKRIPTTTEIPSKRSPDFWEKPVTSIGFIALLAGVVLGLAQYWFSIVFAGFLLLLSGAVLYPVGLLTEKELGMPSEDAGVKS